MKRSDFFTCLKAKILFRFGAIALVLFLVFGLSAVTAQRIGDAQARVSAGTEEAAQLRQELLQESRRQAAAITIQAAVLLALLGNTYVFIRRDVVKPILHIREQCALLSQGRLSPDFSVDCKNADLRRLGDSLNCSVLEIKQYVDDIARAMGELSDRNFNVEPSQPFQGDFKPIETSVGSMIRDLSGTLAQIGGVADQVSAGSDQVAAGAQLVAQGAAEQASSIQELAAAVEDISGQIRQNAKNADRAGGMAKDAAAAIQSSSQQMQRLMSAMRTIDARSKEIENIVKSIQDIAFQTNLLSLNAAVEAARAGAAGRGFAVVAGEVRNLAVKSAEAAKSTTELIKSSVAAIGEGVALAQSAAGDLLQVAEEAGETTAAILEITAATGAQAQSVSQISVGLDQISSVVQQNSATSEQSAAASRELSGQAQALKGLVGQFRLMTA